MTQTLVKVELVKTLLDGEWHSTPCLVAYVNHLIRPEIAYRSYTKTSGKNCKPSDEQRINAGKNTIVRSLLRHLAEMNRIERRNRELSQVAEWRLVDKNWFENFLKDNMKTPS